MIFGWCRVLKWNTQMSTAWNQLPRPFRSRWFSREILPWTANRSTWASTWSMLKPFTHWRRYSGRATLPICRFSSTRSWRISPTCWVLAVMGLRPIAGRPFRSSTKPSIRILFTWMPLPLWVKPIYRITPIRKKANHWMRRGIAAKKRWK